MKTFRYKVVALSVTASLAACSMTTATIQRVNGPAYEAEIVGSDPDSLRLRADNGFTYRVPREEVADIDHPGNVALVVGAALAALGAVTAAGVYNNGDAGAHGDALTVGLIYGIPALILIASGGFAYLTSRHNSRAFDEAITTPRLPPIDHRFVPEPLPPLPGPPAPQPYAPPPPPPPPASTDGGAGAG